LLDEHALLNDHAHLERKAALNALDLLMRWPEQACPKLWQRSLSAVANDETSHLALVLSLLEERDAEITRAHRNPYAQALHLLIRRGKGVDETLDRLLISALIELRSCERFALLGECAENPKLRKVYRALWASEHGHYRTFLSLGAQIVSKRELALRWQYMLTSEARIIAEQTPGSRMHSWAGD
jgi:tRNA-(ms[2]io[6]A)-hydroxylase